MARYQMKLTPDSGGEEGLGIPDWVYNERDPTIWFPVGLILFGVFLWIVAEVVVAVAEDLEAHLRGAAEYVGERNGATCSELEGAGEDDEFLTSAQTLAAGTKSMLDHIKEQEKRIKELESGRPDFAERIDRLRDNPAFLAESHKLELEERIHDLEDKIWNAHEDTSHKSGCWWKVHGVMTVRWNCCEICRKVEGRRRG